MRPKLVRPWRADLVPDARAHVAHAEPLEHGRDAVLHHPARQQVAQRIGGGVVGIGVAVHRQPAAARGLDLAEEAGGAAPVVDAGELQVGDLHVHAGGLGDRDRLAHGLEAAIGLVAHVGGVGGAAAAEHAGERVDLGGVREVAGRGEQAGGQAPGAAGQRLLQQRLHRRHLGGGGGRFSSPIAISRSVLWPTWRMTFTEVAGKAAA